jgi:hypothetical protein
LKGVKLLNTKLASSTSTSNLSVADSSAGGATSSLSTALQTQASVASSVFDSESTSLATETTVNSLARQLDTNTLVLFARTDREKEEWFKLFKKSSKRKLLDSNHFIKQKLSKPSQTSTNAINMGQHTSASEKTPATGELAFSYDATNDKIIYKIIDDSRNQKSGSDAGPIDDPTTATSTSLPNNIVSTQTENALLYDTSLAFMNTFLIRVFADFFTHKYWIEHIRTKIQKKLNTISVPYFMEELRIIDIDLGSVIPLIKQVSEPWYDERGLWAHLEIDYSGGFQMSLATKLNLMKLKSSNSSGLLSLSGSGGSTSASPILAFKKTMSRESSEPSLSIISSSPPKTVEAERSNSLKRSDTDSKSISDSAETLPISIANSNSGSIRKKKNLAIANSDEEDSPESSGDEYVHTGFSNEEENKLIEG